VRFTREVTGTGELMVQGRGAKEEIDIFPGIALDNELSANVIDICPVGALLDKDFLFQQRVWYLTKTPSIDGITASGDNISIEHNKGVIYRLKPRENQAVNKWWITDEVRYGWKFIHSEHRLTLPSIRGEDPFADVDAALAYDTAYETTNTRLESAKRIALMVSPMLSCEDAYLLASYVLSIDSNAVLGVGPVPLHGEDKTFPGGFKMYAEKAPNARGVKRVLAKLTKNVLDFDTFSSTLQREAAIDAVILTGNYPSNWITSGLMNAIDANRARFVVLIDTLRTKLCDRADVIIPAATWAEKAGTFENANNRLQSFERAIKPIDYCKCEAQIALDLIAARDDAPADTYDAAAVRRTMAEKHGLAGMVNDVHHPPAQHEVEPDMQLVEL
jgi:NADH-quinone oxidoreductase subunit G